MMAGETIITLIGTLTADPELRYTASGVPVCGFTVASNSRYLDKTTNEWKDHDAIFMKCSIWRDAAENVTNSLSKGNRVIVAGRLKSRTWETKEGDKRTVIEMDVDEVGPSLKWATAKVMKATREGASSGGGYGSTGTGVDDPWAAAPTVGAGVVGGYSEEAPF
jgi:single-strand DNA-binding protein